ncbi:AGAP007785-PA [Anopheles gambiae str. PEST]|uniref:AGAP007785-PA n=3 Tax=gambiae species complex TaxID=44542 RepID=A7UUT1_ANOGA|nr:uncharacterized protein LOC5668263 [Anopheles gambiae]XP_049464575.1 uncharacterized protein LOC125907283 [Anopheles coluzzii]EDO63616.1 AGAP007785-PA [Anopheles gambiae str. PEST]
MAISCLKNANSNSAENTFLYTPCHCPAEKLLRQQQVRCEKPRMPHRVSRRTQYLAKPRNARGRYEIRAVNRSTKQTELCRSYKEPYASKRIQQLALPHVRKLVAAQQEYRRFIARRQQDQLEKRIKKSIFTVYSRLANVQLPAVDKLKGMSADEWQKHQDWLVRNAQPKQAPAPEPPKRERKPLAALIGRIDSLSEPRFARKKFAGQEKPGPAAKPGALKAMASDHVTKLAEPLERRKRAKGVPVEDTRLPENVLKAVASSRVAELAVAKSYRNVNNEYRDKPFTVEPNALKAKPSDRILELAKPKKVKK